MSGFSSRREVVVQLAMASVLCFSLAACSTEAVASGDESIVIQNTPSSVIVENRTGGAIINAEVQLLTPSFPRPYFVTVTRLANGEKRTFVLEEFRMSDGTPYRRQMAKVRSVKVVGTDVASKAMEREVPFK